MLRYQLNTYQRGSNDRNDEVKLFSNIEGREGVRVIEATKKFLPFITSGTRQEQQVSVRSMNLILALDIEFQEEKKKKKKISFDRVAGYSHSRHVGRWNNKNSQTLGLSPLSRHNFSKNDDAIATYNVTLSSSACTMIIRWRVRERIDIRFRE